MDEEIRFYTTEDVRRILGIGDKKCLELFNREDFPAARPGKAFLVSVKAFNEYFNTRRVSN